MSLHAKGDRPKLLEEKKNVTSRISDTCRYIGFGLLAVYYTIMSGDNAFAKGLYAGQYTYLVLQGLGVAGAIAILFDYLQFVFGYRAVEEALISESQMYDKNSCAYKARQMFFVLKQFAVAVGSVLLVFIVAAGTSGQQ